jgi:hypothetical protein
MRKSLGPKRVENLMTKPNLLPAAMTAAALLLATPAMAWQGQLTSKHLNANARIAATAQNAGKQTCCRNRASDLSGPGERDVWGHWGAYYGPMIH